jgi:hypothetical protein
MGQRMSNAGGGGEAELGADFGGVRQDGAVTRIGVSLAVHAVIAVVMVVGLEHRREGDAGVESRLDVEVVEVSERAPTPTPTPTLTIEVRNETPARNETPDPTTIAQNRTVGHGGSRGRTNPSAGDEGVPELRVEQFGRGGGRGNGAGIGDGEGDGQGDGRGTIGELAQRPMAEPPPPPPPPPAAKISKARPARLVWPNRDEDVEEGHQFVAQVTVDGEGFVVGAHLTKGQNGPRDADAASLVFRFRYEPALDDDGRPIRSQVEQEFQVR